MASPTMATRFWMLLGRFSRNLIFWTTTCNKRQAGIKHMQTPFHAYRNELRGDKKQTCWYTCISVYQPRMKSYVCISTNIKQLSCINIQTCILPYNYSIQLYSSINVHMCPKKEITSIPLTLIAMHDYSVFLCFILNLIHKIQRISISHQPYSTAKSAPLSLLLELHCCFIN